MILKIIKNDFLKIFFETNPKTSYNKEIEILRSFNCTIIYLTINIFNCMILKIIKSHILKILIETNPTIYYMLMFILKLIFEFGFEK
jgi:hypothetical protein